MPEVCNLAGNAAWCTSSETQKPAPALPGFSNFSKNVDHSKNNFQSPDAERVRPPGNPVYSP